MVWRRSRALVVLDGAGTDTIIAEGLGSRRYEITVRGQGGHSWSDFGVANPIVALARDHRALHPDASAGDAEDDVQHRHRQRRNLSELDSRVGDHARGHAFGFCRATGPAGARVARSGERRQFREVTGRKKQELLTAEVRVIGDRPAADLPADSQLLKVIRAVDAQLQQHMPGFSAPRPTPTFRCRWGARRLRSARAAAAAARTP